MVQRPGVGEDRDGVKGVGLGLPWGNILMADDLALGKPIDRTIADLIIRRGGGRAGASDGLKAPQVIMDAHLRGRPAPTVHDRKLDGKAVALAGHLVFLDPELGLRQGRGVADHDIHRGQAGLALQVVGLDAQRVAAVEHLRRVPAKGHVFGQRLA